MKPNGNEAFLQTILSSIADGVFSVDRDWRITSFNPAAERITGVPAEQAIGKRCSDVFHADLCERGCALRESVETGNELVGVRARILDSRGRRLPISLSTAVLRDSEGQFLGAVETFRDLSAIEQLRREIKRQYTFEDIVGKSRAFKKIFALLPDIAESDATVLIEGPSGSGKELLLRVGAVRLCPGGFHRRKARQARTTEAGRGWNNRPRRGERASDGDPGKAPSSSAGARIRAAGKCRDRARERSSGGGDQQEARRAGQRAKVPR
jgi:PAS domain S-box-containing protein